MVSNLKISKSVATKVWLGFGFLMSSGVLFAQDEIDEPAGDIAAAVEDLEPGVDAGSSDETTEDQAVMDDEQEGEPAEENASAEAETEQIGPVWDSYNDNMKSVAQEVTKGLRVEDVVEPPTEYHYAAFGKPDPFVAPMLTRESATAAAISGLEVPIVSPLQRHEIRVLRLVGIWQLKSGERKALILTPQGEEGSNEAGIIVRNGDSVGNRAGKILAIGDSFLTVREFKLAVDGTRQYEDIQMLMGIRDPSTIPGKIKFTPGEARTEVILEGENPAVPVVGGPQGLGQAPALAPRTSRNQDSGLLLRSNPTAAAPGPNGAAPAPTPAAATALPVAPTVPAARPVPPIADPNITGIAPVAGDTLPSSMNGTAPPRNPTGPAVQSPYLPAP